MDRLLRRVPFHPLFFAASVVLAMWAGNRWDVVARDVWVTLLEATGLASALLALSYLLYRDRRRAAILASVATVLLLDFDRLVGFLDDRFGLLLVALVVATVGVWIRRRRLSSPEVLTVFLNVFGAVLVMLPLISIVPTATVRAPDGGPRLLLMDDPDQPMVVPESGSRPDIWYIVLDRYGRADTLAEAYGVDNGGFLTFLEEAGFDVAERSFSNYSMTAPSLAATLNLSYLDPSVTAAEADLRALQPLLTDHAVGRRLNEAGYRYIHLGNWWQYTRTATSADRVLNASWHSEFGQKFVLRTALPALRNVFGLAGVADARELSREHASFQLSELSRLATASEDGPRFVFAHITLPHEPFVFDVDGDWVSEPLSSARGTAESYDRQLQYLNERLRRLVEAIINTDPDSIVVLQADEGPYPERWNHPDVDWTEAPREELRLKFGILTAIRIPGLPESRIPEDVSPVNTLRLVMREVLSAHLRPLRERSYVSPNERDVFDEVDVTEVLGN